MRVSPASGRPTKDCCAGDAVLGATGAGQRGACDGGWWQQRQGPRTHDGRSGAGGVGLARQQKAPQIVNLRGLAES